MKITKQIMETLTLFDACCYEADFKDFVSSFYRAKGESEAYIKSETNYLWEMYIKRGIVGLYMECEQSFCENDRDVVIDLINYLIEEK